MFRRLISIAVAVCCSAFAAGCRVDPYMEVREREWRRLEDEIYYREGVIADLEAQLDSCRRENDALRGRGGSVADPTESLPVPNRDNGDATLPEEIKNFEPPKTDLGTEAPPPLGQVPPPRRLPTLLPASHQAARSIEVVSDHPTRVAEIAAPSSPDVAACAPAIALTLNRRITGGNNTDGCVGDEGILAIVEARDAAGALVPAPGAMSLLLHDPMASGDRGVIAEWNFTDHEVAARFRKGPFGAGHNFDLPWPNRPPQRSVLRLEVRCATPDGKMLTTTQKISVDLQGAPDAAPSTAPTVESTRDANDTLPPWRPTRG
jgi:hypothetical protein